MDKEIDNQGHAQEGKLQGVSGTAEQIDVAFKSRNEGEGDREGHHEEGKTKNHKKGGGDDRPSFLVINREEDQIGEGIANYCE